MFRSPRKQVRLGYNRPTILTFRFEGEGEDPETTEIHHNSRKEAHMLQRWVAYS